MFYVIYLTLCCSNYATPGRHIRDKNYREAKLCSLIWLLDVLREIEWQPCPRKRKYQVRTAEHDHINHVIDDPESICNPDRKHDLIASICALDKHLNGLSVNRHRSGIVHLGQVGNKHIGFIIKYLYIINQSVLNIQQEIK